MNLFSIPTRSFFSLRYPWLRAVCIGAGRHRLAIRCHATGLAPRFCHPRRRVLDPDAPSTFGWQLAQRLGWRLVSQRTWALRRLRRALKSLVRRRWQDRKNRHPRRRGHVSESLCSNRPQTVRRQGAKAPVSGLCFDATRRPMGPAQRVRRYEQCEYQRRRAGWQSVGPARGRVASPAR